MSKLSLVKFKNGKYGVRRFKFLIGYEFAINHTGNFCHKSHELVQEFTQEEAMSIISEITELQKKDSDMGVSINE